MKQREIFRNSEGDAWFTRNQRESAGRNLPDDDMVLMELIGCLPVEAGRVRVLEIGCGEGGRLEWLMKHRNAECFGIDPSAKAVAAALERGVHAQEGTAEQLPFDAGRFDVVIFGFCLYLCDRDDLSRIVFEANRVLRSPGWLLIQDFYSPTPRSRAYHHHPGVQTHKMDYRTLFTGSPDYECMTHKVRHHVDGTYTDDPEEWVSVSVLRKFRKGPIA
ncbi:MAG: class I SAM-dependent methyltransferase [Pseudomonadota bacterium]